MRNRMIKRINLSAIALAATYAFAGRVLLIGKGSLSDVAVAALLAVLIIPLAETAARGVLGSKKRSVLGAIFALAVIAASIYTASLAANEFSEFAAYTMLSGMSELLIKAIFLFLCAYLGSLGEGAVRKLAVIFFAILGAVAVILFLLSVRSLDLSQTDVLFGKITALGVIREFGNIFAPMVLAIIYLSGDGETGRLRCGGAVLSVIFASLLLLICRLNVSLLFGESFAAALAYPYSEAVSTVTAGKLFARMEGWAYLMYYAASALRTSVCLSLCCRPAFRILPRLGEKRVGVFLTSLVFASVCLV